MNMASVIPTPPADLPIATATLVLPDEAALPAVAGRLAAALPPTAFVALRGDLGAGKTTLVKAVAAVLGIDPAEVVSPTFGLIHVHECPPAMAGTAADRQHCGPVHLVHADLYRLSGPADLAETGWEDATAGAGWVFVEWPERIEAALPAERIDLAIAIDGPASRTLALTGRGASHAEAVARLAG
jgi:tRNA A37 threonylcarbamoyladenosine biosynthesis protein TsaE